ncbi:MAG TPA: ATP-binding protein [Chloroflexia bacterium]|nr:ATP-binding protein [Chloroflexia bacterium]
MDQTAPLAAWDAGQRTETSLRQTLGQLEQRNRQLADILACGDLLRLNLDLTAVLHQIVQAIHDSLGFGVVVVNLTDDDGWQLRVHAHIGLDAAGRAALEGAVYPWKTFARLMQERFRIGRSYLIPAGAFDWAGEFPGHVYRPEAPPAGSFPEAERWQPDDALLVPIDLRQGQVAGVIAVDAPRDGRRPSLALIQTLEIFANQAAVAIENARLYAQLQQDLAARKQVAEELAAARDAAERANRAKSVFLSRVSHELRTPLNAILGFAQILEMTDPSPDQQESLAYIVRGGRHLLDLVNEVLDITGIESGRLALIAQPIPLHEVVQESLDLVRPLAAQAQVSLHTAPAPDAPASVLADRQRLRQALLNLLANAVKYNRPGGRVTVIWQAPSDAVLRIAIQDTGLGIPPAKRTRLFSPFDRLDAEQTGVDGTGLGLALTKRLVEAMAGTLGVESVIGEGSTFWIELPRATGLPAPTPHGWEQEE